VTPDTRSSGSFLTRAFLDHPESFLLQRRLGLLLPPAFSRFSAKPSGLPFFPSLCPSRASGWIFLRIYHPEDLFSPPRAISDRRANFPRPLICLASLRSLLGHGLHPHSIDFCVLAVGLIIVTEHIVPLCLLIPPTSDNPFVSPLFPSLFLRVPSPAVAPGLHLTGCIKRRVSLFPPHSPSAPVLTSGMRTHADRRIKR